MRACTAGEPANASTIACARSWNALRIATVSGWRSARATATASARNGWLPNSIVSVISVSLGAIPGGQAAQPARNPGNAWDLEIDATATVRWRSCGRS